jgi:serine/threonine protein kinase/DNA-binding SARP family transcriptional activator/WD40 repeat protein
VGDSEAYAQDVEFHVLGPVEALKDGVSVRLGGPKQRTVLALLLAEAAHTVSADRLIDLLWGDEPTPGARSTLQTYISNLRSEIGELLVREGGGYRLDVQRDQVDALRFEDELARAGDLKDSQPLEAAQRLRDALALWRGHPYADISGSVVLDQEARRLGELRMAAIEGRLDAELALGNHAEVVGELEVLTAEHPFRERFRALHMLSLYRSGRQAEALHAYQKTRTFLAEELGIDPSPALRELEGKILRQDPSLLPEAEPRVETLVFLLADIEDSTVLWELHPRDMGPAARQYDGIIAEAVEAGGGRVVKRVGDGLDSVFTDVGSAVAAAREAQRALALVDWGATGPLKARMAIDVGDVEARGTDYFGPVLNRCGRILAAGHGGQVLLSAEAHAALSGSQAGWEARALGEFRFKGLGRPHQVFQLLVDGLPSEFPPLRIDRLPQVPRTSFERTVRGYELREQVGGGEFGVVYRAYQPSVGREVAIKVIRPEFVNQPAFVRRFEAEAQVVAQLEHPHIVALYDFWRDPEGAYLVMPWLRGGALRDALDRGPWNVEPASRLLKQIGSALAYAHRQGAVHRDLKPANVLLDEEGNAYLSDFAVASRMVDASEAGRPITSSPAYSPPEELRGEPLRPAADIFALGLLTFELLSGRRPPMDRALPAITELRPELPAGIESIIARATADDPAARFASVDEFLEGYFGALGETPPPEEPAFTPTRDPYKGLHAFSELDAQDFFGRGALTEELVQAVKEHPLVAVVGPSGIGKSSVVRAGLIPALRAGALPGSREWVITDMFPGSYPFEELEAALLRVAVERPEGLTEDLARDERGILRVTKRILPPDCQALLVVDQFEELFTLTAEEETRRLFLDALATLALDGRSRVRVVITLRADFFDRPLRYPRFGDLLREGMVAVTAPGEADLAEAITRPGDGVGVHFEPGLVSRIIADVNDQPGALPLLQYALTELFAARTSDLLTIHGYQASGGVLGALGRRAEELYQGLDTQGQEAARQVFLRLVAVSDTAEDARRRVRRQELNGLGVDPELVEEVLRRFGEYRLLSFDRDPLTRGPTVEVAHEALLSEWERLRTWISERREDLLLERRLADAIDEWDRAGKDPSYLLTGGRLEQFATWAGTTDLALTTAERDYLQQGREAAAERRFRVRRRRRSILAALVAAALVSLSLAGVAYNNQRHARESAELARSRELAASAINVLDEDPELSVLLAIEAAKIANPPFEAVKALHEALRQDRIIQTIPWPSNRKLRLGESGEEAFWGQLSPDGRMVVLGGGLGHLEAHEVDHGKLAWSLDIAGSKGLDVPTDGGVFLSRPVFTNDGSKVLAVADWSSKRHPNPPPDVKLGIYEWDAATGRQLRVIPRRSCPRPSFIYQNGPFIDIDRRVTLVSGAGSGCDAGPTVSLLDLKSGKAKFVLDRSALPEVAVNIIRGELPKVIVSVSADERYLARFEVSATALTKIVVMDLRNGRVMFSMTSANREAVLLNHDGSLLLTSGGTAWPVELWDVTSGQKRGQFDHLGVNRMWFNEDETVLFTAGTDGSVRLWDVETGHRILSLQSSGGPVGEANPSAQGDRLATFSADATARVFRLRLGPVGELRTWDLGLTADFNLASSLDLAGSRGSAYVIDEAKGEGSIAVFDRSTKQGKVIIEHVTGQLARLSRDGNRLAAQQGIDPISGTVVVHDLTTGGSVKMQGLCVWRLHAENLQCHDPPQTPFAHFVTDLAFSPDGSLLASGGGFTGRSPRAVVVWNSRTGKLRWSKPLGAIGFDTFTSVAFSPDSRRLVAAFSNGPLAVFDGRTGKEIKRVPVGCCWQMRFTSDGRYLAGGTDDGVVQVLDTQSWKVVRVLNGDQGRIKDVEISPDGTVIASAGQDGSVRTWELASGAPLQAFSLGETSAQDVEFLDDHHLLVRGKNGPILEYTLDTDQLLEIARGRVTRGFTQTECQTYQIDPCPDLAAIQHVED